MTRMWVYILAVMLPTASAVGTPTRVSGSCCRYRLPTGHWQLPGYTDRQGRQTSYTANNVNEYTSINGVTLATSDPATSKYDLAGNLTANEYGYQFVYDYENRLIEVKDKEAGHTTLASYTYDALGHRIKQVKNGRTTLYYYDGETILAEYDGSTGNPLLRYHVHGPTYVDEHILLHEMAHDQQAEGEYYYLLGTLYSVTGLVDATGTVVERYRYDAYGLPTCLGTPPAVRDFIAFQAAFSGNQQCGQAARIYDYNNDGRVDLTDYRLFFDGIRASLGLSPYRFTGQRLDLLVLDETGRPVLALYNYRAREYDAYHGRFLQRDPAEYIDSYNLYLAMGGNPLSKADPTGKFGVAGALIGAAIGAAAGGVLGALLDQDDPWGGALKGAVAGGATGALVGVGLGIPAIAGSLGARLATYSVAGGLAWLGFEGIYTFLPGGNDLNAAQNVKLETAIKIIRDAGYSDIANRASEVEFKAQSGNYGFTTHAFSPTVRLRSAAFDMDDNLFASLVLHETVHAGQTLYCPEEEAYQTESDFLKKVGITGKVYTSQNLANPRPDDLIVRYQNSHEAMLYINDQVYSMNHYHIGNAAFTYGP